MDLEWTIKEEGAFRSVVDSEAAEELEKAE